MIYFEIILQLVAILSGSVDIYSNKFKKKEYKNDRLILLTVALLYSRNSQNEIIQWLVTIVAVMVLFIIIDKFSSNFSKIRKIDIDS